MQHKNLVYLCLSCIAVSVVSLEDTEKETAQVTGTQNTFDLSERLKRTQEPEPVMVHLQTAELE
jgi:hypothetical protein